MARLVDRIWELNWLPPQMLCYKPELRTEAAGGFSIGRTRALMEAHRQAVVAALAYAADPVAEYFYLTAPRDSTLRVADFPAVAIPEDRAFIEFRRPGLRQLEAGEAIARELPHWWGWQVSRHAPAEFQRLLRMTGLRPGCAAGLLCLLWLSPDDRSLIAPLAAVGLQVTGDGEPLGAPLMSLGFPHDPERLHEPERLFGYFNALFLPAVLAMAFLACKSTTVARVDPEPGLNKVRLKRKRRPFAPYHRIDCEPIKDVLRHQGLAGVQGLAGAMRQCRHHFVQDMRGRSALILLPGSP